MRSLQDLPADILLLIFQQLDLENSFGLATVSTKLYSIWEILHRQYITLYDSKLVSKVIEHSLVKSYLKSHSFTILDPYKSGISYRSMASFLDSPHLFYNASNIVTGSPETDIEVGTENDWFGIWKIVPGGVYCANVHDFDLRCSTYLIKGKYELYMDYKIGNPWVDASTIKFQISGKFTEQLFPKFMTNELIREGQLNFLGEFHVQNNSWVEFKMEDKVVKVKRHMLFKSVCFRRINDIPNSSLLACRVSDQKKKDVYEILNQIKRSIYLENSTDTLYPTNTNLF